METNIKFSIVTINYNNDIGLERTIRSVINQTYNDVEYIVIDGGSVDNSVEIIEKYTEQVTYWISEPDKGVYNAMNKGILKATGEYVYMLNSGDYFIEDNILEKVSASMKDSDVDIFYGNVEEETKDKIFITHSPEEVSFGYFLEKSIHHQAIFVKKELHDKVGLYNEENRIVSDWCFLLKAFCRYNCTYNYADITIAHSDRFGISCRPENWEIKKQEVDNFLQKEFPRFLTDYEEKKELKTELAILRRALEHENAKRYSERVLRLIKKIFSVKKKE